MALAHRQRLEPALEEPGIEGVELGRRQLGDHDVAENRHDVDPDGGPVAHQRGRRAALDLQVRHPLLEQLGHGLPPEADVAPFDGPCQLRRRLLGDALATLDRLRDVAVSTGRRIAAGGHPHLPHVRSPLTEASGHTRSATRGRGLWTDYGQAARDTRTIRDRNSR